MRTVSDLRPLVVLGTGFHKWVTHNHRSPLTDWALLVEETKRRLNPATSRQEHPSGVNNAIAWEQMLLDAVRERAGLLTGKVAPEVMGSSQPIHKIENEARKIVTKVIKGAADIYDEVADPSRRRFFEEIGPVDVISLNFESSWAGAVKPGNWLGGLNTSTVSARFKSAAHRRLYYFETFTAGRIWYPNGCLARPETLRLGLRDFGLQADELRAAFDRFKKWESEFRLEQRREPVTNAEFSTVLQALERLEQGPAANWVTHFMLRPVFILGAGLSEEEQGLWWLITQRARNQARVRASTKITILRNSVEERENGRDEFWRSCPLDIEPVWCRDWSDGWRRVGKLLKNWNGAPG
jgi:hypothetical protein